jgi:hypothetical protein
MRALDVIAKSGDTSDIPTVRELVLEYTGAGYMYPMCTSAETLHALRDTASIPWFRDLFVSTQYSYLRKRCAAALADLDSEFPVTVAMECLWDCEPETREAGCRTAIQSVDMVGERLVALANNDSEVDSVRSAARSAIAQRS